MNNLKFGGGCFKQDQKSKYQLFKGLITLSTGEITVTGKCMVCSTHKILIRPTRYKFVANEMACFRRCFRKTTSKYSQSLRTLPFASTNVLNER